MKKILYLGKDEKYIDAIEDRVRNFFFFEKYDHLGKNSLALKKILISSPALLIVDIYDNFINASKLTGLVRNHHELKNIPILCIIKEGDQKELERLSLVGGVIYFIKSGDQDDAVYCIKTLLSPELVLDEKIAKAVFQEQTQLFDIVWINSITSSHLNIETNRKFKNGEDVKVAIPYFPYLFRFQKHKIASEGSKTVQFTFKYSYRLDYGFSYELLRPEDRTKLLMDFTYRLEELPVKDYTYDWIQEFEKKPKKILLVSDKEEFDFESFSSAKSASVKSLETSAKTIIYNWIHHEKNKKALSRDTITIYQQSYGILESGTPFLDGMDTVVRLRHMISDPNDEISTDRPSVVAVYIDEVNTVEKVSQLVRATLGLRDYFPFFILFNYSSENVEEVRSQLQYHFLITTKAELGEGLIMKMLELFRKKKLEKDIKRIYKFFESIKLKGIDPGLLSEQLFYDYKIFKKQEDKESYMYLPLAIEIKWMSEFEIVFTSQQELRIGEVFLLQFPIHLNILIVPNSKSTKESLQKNTYRGLIHFVNDRDKKMLRRFINHVATIAGTRGKPLSNLEIEGIKGKFFTGY